MLTEDQRATIEKRLLRERDLAQEAIDHFERQTDAPFEEQWGGELTTYRFHLADIGTEAMEQEKMFLLASNEGRRLYDVLEALRRLYKEPERFDVCERCGRPIGFERLEVMPTARLCADCQRQVEEAAGVEQE